MRISNGVVKDYFVNVAGYIIIGIYEGNFPTLNDVRMNSKYDLNAFTLNFDAKFPGKKLYSYSFGYMDQYMDPYLDEFYSFSLQRGLNVDIIKYNYYKNHKLKQLSFTPIQNGIANYARITFAGGIAGYWYGFINSSYPTTYYTKVKAYDYTQQEADNETITYLSTLNFDTSQEVELFYTKLYYNLDFDTVKISGDLVNFNSDTSIPNNIPPYDEYLPGRY